MIKIKLSIIGNFLKFTNNKQISATIAKRRVPRSNIVGINLIGLMIASVLGTFILSAIVKISFTVNDNLQLIKAIAELESSARILDKFFTQTITANGYNVSSSNVNNFVISKDGNDNIKFPLWFTGGGNNAVSCSGQLVPATTTTPVNVAIFMQHPNTTASPATSGYITCTDSGTIATPWAANDGSSNMPLVSKSQIADFRLVVSVADTVPATKMANFPITSSNVKAAQYNAAGIKLAILLKSTFPVFNKSRTVSFNNIFTNNTAFSNGTTGDSFLYKLVIIQAPFVYAPITGTQTSISS